MDINFFEEFNASKVKPESLALIIIFCLLTISIFITMFYNQYKIEVLKDEISKRMDVIENPETLGKVSEIKELKSNLENSQIDLDRLSSIDMTINNFNVLNQQILDDIDTRNHNGVILSSINFIEDCIELNGVGANPNRVAEYNEVLSQSDNISEVHIASISLNDGYYNFLINVTLKGDSNETHN